jgi:hypothetical protein
MHSSNRLALALAFVTFAACKEESTTAGPSETIDAGGGTTTTPGIDGGSSSGGTPASSLTWTKGTVTGADVATIGGVAAMAFGGGKFVALARANAAMVNKNQFALTSDDGKSWTEAAAFPLNYKITSLVYTGTRFVGSGIMPSEEGAKAVLATKTDGAAWSFEEMIGVPADSATVVASAGTSLHFAGSLGLMAFKGDGAPTSYTSPFVGSNAFASCAIGTRVITAGQADASKNTDPLLTYSDDVTKAESWKASAEPSVLAREANRFYGLACDADRQIAVGAGNEVWVSNDKGATWTVGNPNGDSTTWQRIVKANGKYVLVGWKGAYGTTTTGTDLAVGVIGGSERNFESLATNGTIVVSGAGGGFNEPVAAEFWWAQP